MKYSEFSRHVQIIFQKKRTESEKRNKKGKMRKNSHTHDDNDHIAMKEKVKRERTNERNDGKADHITKWLCDNQPSFSSSEIRTRERRHGMKLSNVQPKKKVLPEMSIMRNERQRRIRITNDTRTSIRSLYLTLRTKDKKDFSVSITIVVCTIHIHTNAYS